MKPSPTVSSGKDKNKNSSSNYSKTSSYSSSSGHKSSYFIWYDSLVGRVSHWACAWSAVESIDDGRQTVVASGTHITVQSAGIVSTVLPIMNMHTLKS